jgi:hypothetical protein
MLLMIDNKHLHPAASEIIRYPLKYSIILRETRSVNNRHRSLQAG